MCPRKYGYFVCVNKLSCNHYVCVLVSSFCFTLEFGVQFCCLNKQKYLFLFSLIILSKQKTMISNVSFYSQRHLQDISIVYLVCYICIFVCVCVCVRNLKSSIKKLFGMIICVFVCFKKKLQGVALLATLGRPDFNVAFGFISVIHYQQLVRQSKLIVCKKKCMAN